MTETSTATAPQAATPAIPAADHAAMKQAAEGMRKLQVLSNTPFTRTIVGDDGKETVVTVKRVKVGKIPALIDAAGPLMPLLMDRTKGRNTFDIDTMFVYNTASCLKVLGVLIDQPKEFVDELELDDAMMLMADCAEMNIDFFVQRILPLLYGGVQKLVGIMKERNIDPTQLGKTQPQP